MAHAMNERSIPEIFSQLIGQLTTLIRSESQLARAEVSEKIDRLIAAAILAGIGAILLLPALIILLEAVVAGLIQGGTRPALAALIVGGITLIAGVALFFVGLGKLKSMKLVPEKTVRQLQQDVAIAKETRPHHDVQRAA